MLVRLRSILGSSGTIKAVEKAVFNGYVNKSNVFELAKWMYLGMVGRIGG